MSIKLAVLYCFCVTTIVFCSWSNAALSQNLVPGSLWESRQIPGKVVSFAFGDVLGDAQNDIVYLTRDTMVAGVVDGDKIEPVAKHKAGSKTEFHRVHVGDWDADGTTEILVNGFVRGRAFAWLYRSESEKLVLEKEFEGVVMPLAIDGAAFLFKQKMTGRGAFASQIEKLVFSGGQWEAKPYGVKLGWGIGVGARPLYAFATLNNLMAGVSEENRVFVADQKGKKIGRGSLSYGAAIDYFEAPKSDGLGLSREERIFLPARVVADADQLYVIENTVSLGAAVGTLPSVKFAQIQTLRWSGASFGEVATSKRVSGAMTDICLADYDGDGTKEIMAAVVLGQGVLGTYGGGEQSVIVVLRQ